MERKINIAELLKDCPKGMELYSPIFGNVYLDKIRSYLAIVVTTDKEQGDFKEEFLYDGRYEIKGECMLFPSRGKTTWEGFVPPCKFKDGDIIFVKSKESGVELISIYKNESSHLFYDHCSVSLDSETFYLISTPGFIHKNDISINRFASEEEKQKLFDVIKANGYKWNAETKTLEKLSKFKVGDRIKKNKDYISGIITNISDDGMYKIEYQGGGVSYVNVAYQNEWELVPNKFDITTLKPFDKVLCRMDNDDIWGISLFERYAPTNPYPFFCVQDCFSQCIPYNDNTKHLLGTTDDCDEFFRNWE
jgi:hypothetical protein